MRASRPLFGRGALLTVVACAAILAACATQNSVPNAGAPSTSAHTVAAIPSKAALRRRPHSLCAPTGTSYGPVLLNGASDPSSPQILSVSDVSTSETIVQATMSMIIGATGPGNGEEDSGTTQIQFYDFGGKLITSSYPSVAGYVPFSGSGDGFTAYPSCNLSRVVFSFSYSWNDTGSTLSSGTMSQTATMTYPAEPTPVPTSPPTAPPTSSPTPTPTPAQCTELLNSLSTQIARDEGMINEEETIQTSVSNTGYASLSDYQTFVNRASDFKTSAFNFDAIATAAFPNKYQATDEGAISAAYNTVAGDLAFGSPPNIVAGGPYWKQALIDIKNALSVDYKALNTRQTDFQTTLCP